MQNLITVYSPHNFEIFQVRVHSVMSLLDFKKRIAQRFNTNSDNVIVSIGDKQYKGSDEKVEESKLFIQTDLGINEYTVVKVELKDKPKE